MSTLKTANIQDTSGNNNSTPEEISQGRAKAWVNFNGQTGTQGQSNVVIRDSFNVSAVTDNQGGDYSVLFTNNMANTNYCCVGTVFHEAQTTSDMRVVTGQTRAVNNVRVNTAYANGGASGGYDVPGVNIVVFGD